MISNALLGVVLVHVVVSQIPTGDSPIVYTSGGAIKGKTAVTIKENLPFYFFHGIPYAEPPILDFRLRDPVPKEPWDDLLDASQEKPQCIQGANPSTGSEDCLYLNIYTPSLEADSRRAVAVSIHGGAFVSGNGSYNFAFPERFLEENVVFVTLNYRLGFLGFASSGDMVLPGNFGLKDQRQALKWVRANIAKFGGDPDKLTIFGESAGAASVSYHLLSPTTAGLYRNAIMNSGNALCLWALDKRADTKLFKTGDRLGINTTSVETLVEKLREATIEDIQNASDSVAMLDQLPNALEGLLFAPVVEQYYDGAFFFNESAYDLFKAGDWNRVPVLTGVNSLEAAILPMTLPTELYYMNYVINFPLLCPAPLTDDPSVKSLCGYKILDYYFLDSGSYQNISNSTAVLEFVSDDMFNRATLKSAQLMCTSAPVYLYKMSYEGLMGHATNKKIEGVGHSEDMGYLLGTYPNFYNYPENDLLVSERMVRMWANFIKYSDPTPTVDPLLNKKTWQAFDCYGNETNFLNIDLDMEMETDFFFKNMDFSQRLYDELGDGHYYTY